MKHLVTTALVGIGLFTSNRTQATEVPLLTLREVLGQTIQWSWSDGTGGGGSFSSTAADTWTGLLLPMPASASGDFYANWMEDFPGSRNDVYIAPPSGGYALFYATSDVFLTSIVADGTIMTSTDGSYQVRYLDGPDHVVVPDAGSATLMLASSFGALVFFRRRTVAA